MTRSSASPKRPCQPAPASQVSNAPGSRYSPKMWIRRSSNEPPANQPFSASISSVSSEMSHPPSTKPYRSSFVPAMDVEAPISRKSKAQKIAGPRTAFNRLMSCPHWNVRQCAPAGGASRGTLSARGPSGQALLLRSASMSSRPAHAFFAAFVPFLLVTAIYLVPVGGSGIQKNPNQLVRIQLTVALLVDHAVHVDSLLGVYGESQDQSVRE